jgi:ankyrin repeat protein
MNNQLVEACVIGNLEEVNNLIELGANIHAGNELAIIITASYRNIEIMNRLIELGANIHARNEQSLRNAVGYRNNKIVDLLIKSGADIDIAIEYSDEDEKPNLLKIREEYSQPLVKSAIMV